MSEVHSDPPSDDLTAIALMRQAENSVKAIKLELLQSKSSMVTLV